MLRKLLLLPFIALILQAQLQVPSVGSIRCADGSVRPVYGLPASFVLGKPLLSSAVASSFSKSGGIVATADSIKLLNAAGQFVAAFKASDPRALVDIGAEVSSAIAWLPQTLSLVFWEGSAFSEIVLSSPPSGRVTALRRDNSNAVLLVLEEGGGVSENVISLRSGNLVSATFLPGVEGAAFRQGDFVLFPNATGLEMEGPDGAQLIPIPNVGLKTGPMPLGIERMAQDWLHVTSAASTRHWALHFANGAMELFELPGIPRPVVAK